MFGKNVKIDKKSSKSLALLFHEGNNFRSFDYLGAHFEKRKNAKGVVFRVWAPKAKKVYVVGDFNGWHERKFRMKKITDAGIFELFIKEAKEFNKYNFIVYSKGKRIKKADPYAFFSETNGGASSILYNLEGYKWTDEEYINRKKSIYDQPINIYEVNLASWKRHKDGSYYTYKEYAEELVPYVLKMGYTHVEFMPILEYPYDGSWGYQVTGYYSVTSRFGTPKDFMFLVDSFHENNIGVILDWVPGHFPKDEHGLFEFDGSACYENSCSLMNEHRRWGTRVFDWGKKEVQSFLISSAEFLFEKFHVDGLRVDAVASMLYLDYDRSDGEWIPNKEGTNINLDAVEFLRKLNIEIFSKYSNALMIAEESSTFPKVTRPVYEGGLGFNYKWNMGWMNDVLSYMQTDPYFRSGCHNKITFSMCYAFSENFILAISHDEVVYGKKSLIDKMPGNIEEKFSNQRAFLAYMYSHPGKKLSFMGNEYGQFKEWDYNDGLEFFMLDFDLHKKLQNFNKDINELYKTSTPLYEIDDSWKGFNWILPDESQSNVICYERIDKKGNKLVVIINFSGKDIEKYRIGVDEGTYSLLLCSDDIKYGGSGQIKKKTYTAIRKREHGKEFSISFRLPKLSGLYFVRR